MKMGILFGRKKKNLSTGEDPVARYGRLLRRKKEKAGFARDKPSFLARIFRSGCDRDFVYYED